MNKETNNREEVSTGEAFTASERRRVFWLVLVLIPLSWTSIKIVLPALPELGNVFHSTAGVKLSVSLYLIFFACSQPVWGGIVQKTTLWPVAGYLGTLSLIGLAASYFWVWLPYRGEKG